MQGSKDTLTTDSTEEQSSERPADATPFTSRFTHFNQFVERGQADLRAKNCGASVALWFTIWKHECKQTGTARVSVRTLASEYGTLPRNVYTMLNDLRTHGYLITVKPGRRGRGSCAEYRLAAPVIGVPSTPITSGQTAPTAQPEKVCPAHLLPPLKGVLGTPVQRRTEKKKTEERAPAPPNPPHEPTAKPVDATDAGPTPRRGEEKTPGGKPLSVHAQAVAIFCEAWKTARGTKYPFAAKDAAHVRDVLKHVQGNVGAFALIVQRYFAHPDPWFAADGYRLGTMLSQLAKFLIDAPEPARRSTRAGEQQVFVLSQVAEAMAYSEMERRAEDAAQPAPTAARVLILNASTGETRTEIATQSVPTVVTRVERPECLPIPLALDTPEFRRAWHSRLAQSMGWFRPIEAVEAELNALAQIGVAKAVRALDRADIRGLKTLDLAC